MTDASGLPVNDRVQAALDSILVRAVETLDVESVKHWLDKGAHVRVTRTLPAAKPGDTPTVLSLMDLAWWQILRREPEHRAATGEQAEAMIALLIERGGDPNACAWSVWMNSPALFLPFIRAGVKLNGGEGLDDHHPLVWWYQQQRRPIEPAILDAMIAQGMDVHRCVNAHPLLAFALAANDTVAAERLMRAGAHARDFILPVAEIVGQEANREDPQREAATRATLAWWVEQEKAMLRQALDEAPGRTVSPAAARARGRL